VSSAFDLEARHLSLRLGTGHAQIQVLRNVSLLARGGEMTLLRGPSGSGKTTLLSVLGGLLKPDQGQVSLQGVDLLSGTPDERAAARLRNIGFVFQAFRLIAAMSVADNVALPLRLAGRAREDARDRALQLLDQLGMQRHAEALPETLSGGEKQRVALARALANNPPVILADEPTASLDSASGAAVAGLLQRVAREQGRAVLVVSHDERLLPYADRVIQMLDGAIEHEDPVT
jgi:putative ABC transport system ATP-binding protein